MQRKTKKPKRSTKRRVGRVKQQRVVTSEATSGNASITATEIATNHQAAIDEGQLVGQLGDHHQMNTVEVNEAALIAETNAAVASAPIEDVPLDPNAPQPEQQATPEQIQQGYEVLFTGVVGWGSQTFAPNWAVTADETHKLSSALAGACMLWFPDQPIPPKYIAVLSVIAVGAEIVMSRRDPETGMLKPLNAKSTTKAAQASNPNKTEAV